MKGARASHPTVKSGSGLCAGFTAPCVQKCRLLRTTFPSNPFAALASAGARRMRQVPPRLVSGPPLRTRCPVRSRRSRRCSHGARLAAPPGLSRIRCALALVSAMIRQELSTSYQEVRGNGGVGTKFPGRRRHGVPGVWVGGSRGASGSAASERVSASG